jgi:epoxide hydrolase-like predicted phosphatase
MPDYKAVIFDLGGVVLDSPLHFFTRWEKERGLEPNFIGRVVIGSGPDGAWSRLERGELDMAAFCTAFDTELAAAGQSISSAELMMELGRTTLVRPVMIEAILRIKRRGLKVAALTNNWVSNDGQDDRMNQLRALFDTFVESWKTGMRKPDPRIYQLVLGELGVEPEQAIFLDDIGQNLKTARQLGITTIKVTDAVSALQELGRTLDLSLLEAPE